MLLCYQISNNQVTVVNDVFAHNQKNTIFYLESIVKYYKYISGLNLTVDIYLYDDIPAVSISMKEKIYFRSSLIEMKDVAMYLYFPHEIFHQLIGNDVKFVGDGRLWMLESFTEYLQLRYIMYINKNLANRHTRFLLKRYRDNILNDVPIVGINGESPELQIVAAIESRGVLLFQIYFMNVDDNHLRMMLEKLTKVKNVSITVFRQICDEIGVDVERLSSEINNIGNYDQIETEIIKGMHI
ncbi:MAG: hypothetical protein KIC94_15400 [Clostridiales bacterium]|nr:hypothetical protein [Clostridiales bacterium]